MTVKNTVKPLDCVKSYIINLEEKHHVACELKSSVLLSIKRKRKNVYKNKSGKKISEKY